VGVDYIIHVQVALRRQHGDVSAMRRVTGRAILLCAATNVDGFGSNALSSNPGLASLGLVCALGITVAYGTAVFLVPAWWRRFAPEATGWVSGRVADAIAVASPAAVASGSAALSRPQPRPAQPSAAYGPGLWRLGLWVVRWLPRPGCDFLAWVAAAIYRVARPARFGVVRDNLLPVFAGDRGAAERTARRLFRQFARKLVDLWRYEGGAPVGHWLTCWSGRERLESALKGGQGVLLVTVHLGNWEFGGPFLKANGVSLLVVTQPEPGEGFTELRQASRARWGIETLVVRNDPFAFVEIIKRLQAGAVVALLVDRPPPPTAVRVELFGRPLDASVSAALLARATGATLLPVYIVREAGGYGAHILPEVNYDRAVLGTAPARQALTQEILRAFEPVIRQYPDQWFHFVPIWPGADVTSR
jgi:KDO2-lipid IV(A) lauroyltransferase